jgi:predicted DNA-binding transcriptional regulator YafY
MSRAERLLSLIEALRRHRMPVSGARLAEELGISVRSIYRDIVALRGQGATIDGEAGVGYVLKPGFLLPPLMFSETEIEAVVLGSRWVAQRGDAELARAARNALAKILTVLPKDLRGEAEGSSLIVGRGEGIAAGEREVALIRAAIRRERKLSIAYRDRAEQSTRRVIWPFALAYFDRARVIAAWCELRGGFRHFRADRIDALEVVEERYPRRRAALLQAWREIEGVPPPP